MQVIHFPPKQLHLIKLPTPEFLCDPLIPYGGIVVLHGPKTAGKTQLAVTLGAAVAEGTSFLEDFPCKPGRVLFVEADMPLGLLQSRVLRAPVTEAFSFLHSEPFDVCSLVLQARAHIAPLPEAFLQAQAEIPQFVIVDTLRNTHGRDENDSNTPSQVYSAWRWLFPGATFLFLHHDRKKSTHPHAQSIPDEAFRGTGAWLDNADGGLGLDKVRDRKDGQHTAVLSFTKLRQAADLAPVMLLMHPETLLVERAETTTRHKLQIWRRDHPAGTVEDARVFLTGLQVSRTLAYKLAKEVVQ